MKTVLFVGHTGTLGKALVPVLLESYNVIGVSRRPANRIKEYVSDITRDPSFKCLSADDIKSIDHIIYAPPGGTWCKLNELTMVAMQSAFNLTVVGLVNLINRCMENWDDNKPRSITVLGSIASENVYGDKQTLYATVKGAQVTLVKQLVPKLSIKNVRINILLPNSFPSIVKTQSVNNHILQLLESDSNGQKIIIER